MLGILGAGSFPSLNQLGFASAKAPARNNDGSERNDDPKALVGGIVEFLAK